MNDNFDRFKYPGYIATIINFPNGNSCIDYWLERGYNNRKGYMVDGCEYVSRYPIPYEHHYYKHYVDEVCEDGSEIWFEQFVEEYYR